MNIHDIKVKKYFCSMGVAVPEGRVAFTAEEAVEKAKELNSDVYVVKAQIHAGGRGKAGGVKIEIFI
ncbi:ATP-grasp domain-containing protein [Staphylococcus aureus]